jgi:hypothetical protein
MVFNPGWDLIKTKLKTSIMIDNNQGVHDLRSYFIKQYTAQTTLDYYPNFQEKHSGCVVVTVNQWPKYVQNFSNSSI